MSLTGHHIPFVLSADGRLLAWQRGSCVVEVRRVGDGLSQLASSPRGRCHQDVQVELGDMWLTMQVGKMTHLVRWDGPTLEVKMTVGDKATFVRQELANLAQMSLHSTGVKLLRQTLPKPVWYDKRRFVAGAEGVLNVAVDAFGQVALFERTGELICIFFVYRVEFAVWLPDGTRYTTATWDGGLGPTGSVVSIVQADLALDSSASSPPAPNVAAVKIAQALRDAWKRGLESKP